MKRSTKAMLIGCIFALSLIVIQVRDGRSDERFVDLQLYEARPATAEHMANAITRFANDYVPSEAVGERPRERSLTAQDDSVREFARATRSRSAVFEDDFTSDDREGWFNIDSDTFKLSVDAKSQRMGPSNELSFVSSDPKSVGAFATHFDEVRLTNAGDFVSLSFDARHDNEEFVNRGFRFGLFHSGGTRFHADGDLDTDPRSLNDTGYFALLDLGSSTSFDSAVIRENILSTEERLWNGGKIAADESDKNPDPLIFTRGKRYSYTLTLTRNARNGIDAVLKNHVTGELDALKGSSKITPTLEFDTIYFGVAGSIAHFVVDNVKVTDNQTADLDSMPADIARVGVYIDTGAGRSVNDLLFVLEKLDGVAITRLTADEIRSGKLRDLDLLMQPGGSGGGQGRTLGEDGREEIRRFVREGGGFVGICAGSYLASADYKWSLNIIDARVVDRAHWNRGVGTVDISITDAGQRFFKTTLAQLPIHYGQGPLLAPANREDIEDFESIATFKTEVAMNGAPRGVMSGTTAIAKGRYGNGKVVCFSPHPEMTNGLESLVRLAVEHVKRINRN